MGAQRFDDVNFTTTCGEPEQVFAPMNTSLVSQRLRFLLTLRCAHAIGK